jgi:hypothetical protein
MLFDVLKIMNEQKKVIFVECSTRQKSSFRAVNRAAIDGIVHTFPWPQCGIHDRNNME